MSKIPQIRVLFILTKKDSIDFDRDAVTQRLGILPSKTHAPTMTKGMLTCDLAVEEIEKDLSGFTIISAEKPPYKMLKHADWEVESPKVESWDLEEPLQRMEEIFEGKAGEVSAICKDYNLYADLIIRVFADSNNMPELVFSNPQISFWASMGASISFDFYLD